MTREIETGQNLTPATTPTLYFIGVTTGQSSIQKVFPVWAKELGLKGAVLRGVDFELGAPAEQYRAVVEFIKKDPLSMGALVTTHKLDVFRTCRDLIDVIDPHAAEMAEVSCLSKRDGKLIAHAKDAHTARHALGAIVPPGHFAATGAEAFIIGCGGAGIALTQNLRAEKRGKDRPSRIIISDRDETRLAALRQICADNQSSVETEIVTANDASVNDQILGSLKNSSLVVNATGMGKDRPGSPLTNAGAFPQDGIVWEFNYRGNLLFVEQATAQATAKNLTIRDGWDYFIHGWSSIVAEVFDLDIEPNGPVHLELSKLAEDATGR